MAKKQPAQRPGSWEWALVNTARFLEEGADIHDALNSLPGGQTMTAYKITLTYAISADSLATAQEQAMHTYRELYKEGSASWLFDLDVTLMPGEGTP
jgi:hypothetical protein